MERTQLHSPLVIISILNWNRIGDTLECLESVYSMNYDNYQVVVVDNNSSDNSVDMLRNKYPNLHIIESKFNTGFTGGNNIVIEYAIKGGADYVWLLNNDTVVDKNSLKRLVDLGESSESIGMVSPVIYHYADRGRRQFSGSKVNWTNMKIEYPDLNPNSVVDSEYLTGRNVCLWGTALLLKTELINKIGNLKNEYFAYWEDNEYSMRSIKNSYKNVVCSDSKVYHKVRCSQTKRNSYFYYYMIRNRIFLIKEYANRIKMFRLIIAIILHEVSLCLKFKYDERLEASLHGAWHGLKDIGGSMSTKCNIPPLLKKGLILMASKPLFLWAYLLDGEFKFIYEKFKDRCINY